VKQFTTLTKGFQQVTKGTNAVEHALVLLGGVATVVAGRLAIAWAAPLLAFAKWALILGVIYLVFDDLMTLFEGGDSVIGRLIDSIFGPGSATEAVNYLKEAGQGMKLVYQDEVWPAMEDVGKKLYELFNDTAEQADKQGLAMERNLERAHGWVDFVKDWQAGIELLDEAWGAFLDTWKKGFEQVAQAADKLSQTLSNIPGVETLANLLLGPTAQTGGGERRTYERGLGAAAGGPAGEIPAPLQAGQGVAPGVQVAGAGAAGAGTVVENEANLNLTVQVPPGASAQDVARETEGVVRRVMREERRATMAAVKQRAGGV